MLIWKKIFCSDLNRDYRIPIKNGAPGRTRTCCLKIRSLALYPDELRAPRILPLTALRASAKPVMHGPCPIYPAPVKLPAGRRADPFAIMIS